MAMISRRERELAQNSVLQLDSLERRVRGMRGPSLDELTEEVKALALKTRDCKTREMLSRLDVAVLEQLGLVCGDGVAGRSVQDILNGIAAGTIPEDGQEAITCIAIHEKLIEIMPCVPDVIEKPSLDGRLLGNLYLISRLRELHATQEELEKAVRSVVVASAPLRNVTNLVGVLLMGDARRAEVLEALRVVSSALPGLEARTASLSKSMDQAIAIAAAGAWTDYELRTDYYNSEISRFSGIPYFEDNPVSSYEVAVIAKRFEEDAKAIKERIDDCVLPSREEVTQTIREFVHVLRRERAIKLLEGLSVKCLEPMVIMSNLNEPYPSIGSLVGADPSVALASATFEAGSREVTTDIVHTIYDSTVAVMPVDLDRSGRCELQESLVRRLLLLDRLSDLRSTRANAKDRCANLQELSNEMMADGGFLGNLFMPESKKARYEEIIRRTSVEFASICDTVKKVEAWVDERSADDADWKRYESKREYYNTVLKTIVPDIKFDSAPHIADKLARTGEELLTKVNNLDVEIRALKVPTAEGLRQTVCALVEEERTACATDLLRQVPVEAFAPIGICANIEQPHGSSVGEIVSSRTAWGKDSALEPVRSMALEVLRNTIAITPFGIDSISRPSTHGKIVKAVLGLSDLPRVQLDFDAALGMLSTMKSCGRVVNKNGGYLQNLVMNTSREKELAEAVCTLEAKLPDIEKRVGRLRSWIANMEADANEEDWARYVTKRYEVNRTIYGFVGGCRGDSPVVTYQLARDALGLLDRLEKCDKWFGTLTLPNAKEAGETAKVIHVLTVPTTEELRQTVSSLVEEERAAIAVEILNQIPTEALVPLGVRANLAQSVGGSLGMIISSHDDWDRSPALKPVRDAALEVLKETIAITPFEIDSASRPPSHGMVVKAVLELDVVPDIRRELDDALGILPRMKSYAKVINERGGYIENLVMSQSREEEVAGAVASLGLMLPDLERREGCLRSKIANINVDANEQDWARYVENRDEVNRIIYEIVGECRGGNPVVTYKLARDALDLLDRLDRCDKRLGILTSPDTTKMVKEIKENAHGLRELEARQRLHEIDVGVLVHGGARVGALRSAGYNTLGDLVGVDPEDLSKRRGITQTMGRQVARAVGEIYDSAFKASGIRINIEDKPTQHSLLVCAIYKKRLWDKIRNDLADANASLSQTKSIPREIKTDPGYRGNLTMTKERKTVFEGEAAELEQMLDKLEPAIDKLTSDIFAAENLNTSDAWEDFKKNAASYYAMIDVLAGVGSSRTAGDLPSGLVDKVSRFPLDVSLMRSQLRGYQKFAAQYELTQRNTLIGDEMGLGKTVEAIAAMAHLASEDKGTSFFVVVCPLSVLVNWTREVPRHARLQAIPIHGSKREDAFFYWRRNGGVAVTTYETVSRLPWYQLIGKEIDLLVVDEAHYVKNPEAKRSKAVKGLTYHSKRILFLTGTPLENNVYEMNSLVSYLDFTLYLHLKYKVIQNPIEYREAISPVYLRRKRVDVLDELPRKIEKRDWCALTSVDKEDYRDALRSGSFSGMRRVGWRHSKLLDSARYSAKATRLLEICAEAKANGRKVLVFSYFLDTLWKVASIVKDECAGVISGKVPAIKRQKMVDEFSSSHKTVLVSQVMAGGVGLNIQAASVVVFCEPQLKPSTEDQAISRSFRMGQVNTVVVHRLLMDKTVDERIEQILAEKRLAFRNYADESKTGKESLDVIDTIAILKIIEEERARYGITDGKAVTTRSVSSDK